MSISQAILGFAVVAAMLTVIPGLDTTLVLRTAIVAGRRRAMFAGLGVCTGTLAWGVAAAVGAAALLATSEIAYRIVTLAGAAYIVFLGLTMVVRSFRRQPHGEELTVRSGSSWRSFATGFATNLLNPKVGVFYVATIPQFTPHGVSPLIMGVVLAMVHNTLGLVWFAAIILGAGAARRWLANARSLRIIDRVAGTVLVGFGARLALEHR